jgi:hypothetical protein
MFTFFGAFASFGLADLAECPRGISCATNAGRTSFGRGRGHGFLGGCGGGFGHYGATTLAQ